MKFARPLRRADILPTGYQAAEMGGIEEGDTVVVFGCGPVGLFAQKTAWMMGAGRVIAVDRLTDRLAFAEEYNGVETADCSAVDHIVAKLKQMTDGRGPDICIDAVGLEADQSHFHEFRPSPSTPSTGSPDRRTSSRRRPFPHEASGNRMVDSWLLEAYYQPYGLR